MKSDNTVRHEKIIWSLPPRGAWIEITKGNGGNVVVRSLPPRGAWVEILLAAVLEKVFWVAPPTGSVD